MKNKWLNLILVVALLAVATLACGSGDGEDRDTGGGGGGGGGGEIDTGNGDGGESGGGGGGGGGDAYSLTIVNESGVEIWYLYVSPSSSDDWGEDQLGSYTIGEGESFTLTDIPADTYDMKVEGMGHETIETQMGVTIDSDITWTVTGN